MPDIQLTKGDIVLSRRNLLTTGAAAVGAGALTGTFTSPAAEAAAKPTPSTAAGSIPKFAVAMPVPEVLRPVRRSWNTDYYRMTMRTVSTEIVPGHQTEVLTYDGSFPGPTIMAESGRRVVVEQTNALDTPVSVHLHGASVPTSSDGYPMNVIEPGGTRTYTYPNVQPNANLWMHDHAHMEEAEHVYRGMSSMVVLSDAAERKLGLPSGEYDVPLVIRDVDLDDNAGIVFTMDDSVNRTTILVNGKPWPYFTVEARKYRFRVLNSTNLRWLAPFLADASSYTMVGSDGGLLEAPYSTPAVVLSPGERADIVIDFSTYAPGTSVVLQNLAGTGDPAEIMRFDVVAAKAEDHSRVPAALRTLPALPTPTVQRSVVLTMDEDGRPNPMGYINGKTFDMNRIDTTVRFGDTEVWTVSNGNVTTPHNFHMHLVQYRVLERNGKPVDPSEAGLKDVVALLPGEEVKIQMTFDSYRGLYLYHCHLMDHSAMGMMAQMEIV
ncbi:multicopper oxidase domain-containing protein [Streptomyces sp. SL13]|jgi:spore coat protein A|uniref:Multicopper oxidase CueO n=1 Tax=Streptantibioticus silvisoli TaxID=2705255 RepID=A0AA90JYX2_9ACTN|nr:multicopper oxidase domain-containing protein [Streptantibioticus silvisoli]MDI5971621.1 multicopper oxidase domain-containing protein [Streptantibioticus silvisoli]